MKSSNGMLAGYAKTRLPHSGALLRLSRLARWISPHVHGLSVKEWKNWECQAWQLIHGIQIETTGRGILTPAISGVRLCDLLSSSKANMPAKLQAIRAAFTELRRAHTLSALWPDGNSRRFSHSDAHAGNVFFDETTGKAHWFDFETIHDCHLSEAWRQADDFRALAWSAAACSEMALWPALIEIVFDVCPEEVREHLLGSSEMIAKRAHPLHFSQAPMPQKHQHQFSEMMIRGACKFSSLLPQII